ncbi:hypothetical protein DY000_02047090 [Brassica cretica]|uniref:Uncharacterized protein n=1 Tax=Brassica cretica TaxID=69181 RepID=A0ABQ7EU00_BRACR|nr:hypothetical protein DY000_02047090 [Brassica cretica]
MENNQLSAVLGGQHGSSLQVSEIPKEVVKQSIGKRYSHICRTFREIVYVAAEHIELTSCIDEDAIELLKKLEEKKKKLVRANKWMPHSSEDKLVEEEEEDEDVLLVPSFLALQVSFFFFFILCSFFCATLVCSSSSSM